MVPTVSKTVGEGESFEQEIPQSWCLCTCGGIFRLLNIICRGVRDSHEVARNFWVTQQSKSRTPSCYIKTHAEWVRSDLCFCGARSELADATQHRLWRWVSTLSQHLQRPLEEILEAFRLVLTTRWNKGCWSDWIMMVLASGHLVGVFWEWGSSAGMAWTKMGWDRAL